MSVFTGGCTAAAVGRVLSVPGDGATDALGALVDHSLMTVSRFTGRTRFSMLESVRQYAEARLAATGGLADGRTAHAAWAVEWLEAADAGPRSADEATWAAVLDDERANLRSAHRWLLDHDLHRAERLIAAAFWYAYFYAPAEVFGWTDETVARARAGPSRHLPGALATAALGAWRRGDLARARVLAQRAITTADDPSEARFAWEAMRSVELLSGNLERSLECRDRAMELARLAGDPIQEAQDHATGALALGYMGQLDEADAELALAASLLESVDNPVGAGVPRLRRRRDPRRCRPGGGAPVSGAQP